MTAETQRNGGHSTLRPWSSFSVLRRLSREPSNAIKHIVHLNSSLPHAARFAVPAKEHDGPLLATGRARVPGSTSAHFPVCLQGRSVLASPKRTFLELEEEKSSMRGS